MEDYNTNNLSQEEINIGSIDINKFITSTASFQSLWENVNDNTLNEDSELRSEVEYYNEIDTSKKVFELSKTNKHLQSLAQTESKIASNPEFESRIRQLSTEISEKQDKIDHLEIKAKQAELYKEQNLNLK